MIMMYHGVTELTCLFEPFELEPARGRRLAVLPVPTLRSHSAVPHGGRLGPQVLLPSRRHLPLFLRKGAVGAADVVPEAAAPELSMQPNPVAASRDKLSPRL